MTSIRTIGYLFGRALQVGPMLVFSLMLLVFLSCRKTKEDPRLSDANVLNSPASGIRLFNFTNGNLNIAVNNVQLTNFESLNTNVSSALGTALGLQYFPAGVWKSGSDGNPFTVPSGLLNKKGEARIIIQPGRATNTQEFPGPVNLDTTLKDDPLAPKDFYLLSNGSVVVISRSLEVPVQPDHFKLRILNLGAPNDMLQLSGPVTLTYADGKVVDPALSNVQMGSISPYAEIPYGTYQFKLFVNGDWTKQLAEVGTNPRYDGCRRTAGLQVALEPLIRTFLPGGTYSIVITQNYFKYNDCSGTESIVGMNANAYRVLTENKPPLNTSYARVQAVNALPGRTITVKVDGQVLQDNLNFGMSTNYRALITGSRSIEVSDAKGTSLAAATIVLSASDNATAWVYEKDGKPAILMVENMMSAYHYISQVPGDDGTNGAAHIQKLPAAWQCRFLNLSADQPSITFSNDGQPFITPVSSTDTFNIPGSYQNLAQGIVPLHDPYVIIPYTGNRSDNKGGIFYLQGLVPMPPIIRVHNSAAVTPGPLVPGVTPLYFRDFISNPLLYPTSGGTPVSETGIYSVALVGRTADGTAASEQARMIIVKHNR